MKADITFQSNPGYMLLQVNGQTERGKVRVTVYRDKITVAEWDREDGRAGRVQEFKLV